MKRMAFSLIYFSPAFNCRVEPMVGDYCINRKKARSKVFDVL